MKLDMAVHPVADLFPMLPDDELQDLAEDIKLRGQLQPIVMDSDGRILDGRNRFAACKLAGVEPKFSTYEGDDPDGYALAVNIARRHMSKGQKAMVIAKSILKINMRQTDAVTQYGVSQPYISMASVVLKHGTDADANAVLSGKPLKDAYDAAVQSKEKNDKEQFAVGELRKEHPDLADLVDDGEMTLTEALSIRDQRRMDAARAERVAPIDSLVAESGGRTFAARVEAEELTWAEAEELAVKWKREWDESVQRNVRRIQEVAAAFPALSRLFDAPDEHFNMAVTEKLDATAMKFIRSILNEINEKADKWNGAWK